LKVGSRKKISGRRFLRVRVAASEKDREKPFATRTRAIFDYFRVSL